MRCSVGLLGRANELPETQSLRDAAPSCCPARPSSSAPATSFEPSRPVWMPQDGVCFRASMSRRYAASHNPRSLPPHSSRANLYHTSLAGRLRSDSEKPSKTAFRLLAFACAITEAEGVTRTSGFELVRHSNNARPPPHGRGHAPRHRSSICPARGAAASHQIARRR